jgi:uncharacterized protein HemX
MKRIIGSLTAVMLALSLGMATYAKATQNQSSAKTKPAAMAQNGSMTKHKNRKSKHRRHRRTTHHKTVKAPRERK